MQATENDQIEENIYEFMNDGIFEIQHDERLQDIDCIIEELETNQALEYVHTIRTYTNVLCKYDQLWAALSVFAQKTDKVINLSLDHCDVDKEPSCSMNRVIEFLCAFKNVLHLKLVLGYARYSLDDIHMLRQYFNSSTTIKNVRLEANYHVIHNIAKSIEYNESIETVDLTIHNMTNIKSTTPIFVLHKIKKIGFSNCNVSLPSGHVARFNAFFESFLASNSTITELNLCKMFMNTGTIRIISDFVIAAKALITLSVRYCTINDESVNSLIRAIETSNVENLYISDNNIGYEGALCIAAMLRLNNSLKFIDVSNNPIIYQGIVEILKSLTINSTLRKFCCTSTVSVIGETVESITQTFEKILLDNYTLTKFFMALRFERDGGKSYGWIELDNITQRNKAAITESRFSKTKVAAR